MGPLNECEDLRAQSPAQSRGKGLGEEIERQHQIQEHKHTGMERIHYKLENQFWLRMSKLKKAQWNWGYYLGKASDQSYVGTEGI